MAKRQKSPASRRVKAHAALLERALGMPRLQKCWRAYRQWREKDRGLDAYRRATKDPRHAVTTDNGQPR